MKLSEAIRVGSKLHPQGFGNTRVVIHKHTWWCRLGFTKCEQVVTTCALGAAFEAGDCPTVESDGDKFTPLRGNDNSGGLVQVPDDWLTILHLAQLCPQCELAEPLCRLIPHLNDDHKWTREEIALLVERVETVHAVNHPESDVIVPAVESEWPEVVG